MIGPRCGAQWSRFGSHVRAAHNHGEGLPAVPAARRPRGSRCVPPRREYSAPLGHRRKLVGKLVDPRGVRSVVPFLRETQCLMLRCELRKSIDLYLTPGEMTGVLEALGFTEVARRSVGRDPRHVREHPLAEASERDLAQLLEHLPVGWRDVVHGSGSLWRPPSPRLLPMPRLRQTGRRVAASRSPEGAARPET